MGFTAIGSGYTYLITAGSLPSMSSSSGDHCELVRESNIWHEEQQCNVKQQEQCKVKQQQYAIEKQQERNDSKQGEATRTTMQSEGTRTQ